jgi:hypothetical protein
VTEGDQRERKRGERGRGEGELTGAVREGGRRVLGLERRRIRRRRVIKARLLGFGWLTRVGMERNCRDEDGRGERDSRGGKTEDGVGCASVGLGLACATLSGLRLAGLLRSA